MYIIMQMMVDHKREVAHYVFLKYIEQQKNFTYK
jgi:hypothetical protein